MSESGATKAASIWRGQEFRFSKAWRLRRRDRVCEAKGHF